MYPFRSLLIIVTMSIIALFAVYISQSINKVYAAGIDANLSKYNGIDTYNINADFPHFNFQSVKTSKYAYELAELNKSIDFNQIFSLLGFARVMQHSTQSHKLEQTVSGGLRYKKCSVSVGVRDDILGKELLLRPSCTFKTFNLQHKYSYIHTAVSNYFSAKLKLFLSEKIYLATTYKAFTGRRVDTYDWKLHTVSIGLGF
jgi:hypothetical protein